MAQTQDDAKPKRFPNGDTYEGGWASGLPEGRGDYRWSDGSSYSGDWKAGQKHGMGLYKWPSGATYEGEWDNGNMQGVGTFEATDGTVYSGSWRRNQKDGLGKKQYANSDSYEGLWKRGRASGPGRYMWVDGNEYDGEWREGVMHGTGTFVWRTGERYDGEWRDGLEDGQGVFMWADGAKFDGFWSRGKKHGIGLYRPAHTNTRGEGRSSTMRRTLSTTPEDEGLSPQRSPAAGATARPSPNQPETEEPVRTLSMTQRRGSMTPADRAAYPPGEALYVREYVRGRVVRTTPITGSEAVAMLSSLIGENEARHKRKLFSGKNDKAGETIQEGHRSYELMLDLQLGVRWSVGKFTHTLPPRGQLLPEHFSEKVKVTFPRQGSRATPPHPTADFRWKDYAPKVFGKLRDIFVVDPATYMLSLCGDKALRELSSPGKSGALFYISHDDRFLIKTMRDGEVKTFLRMLQAYYDHVRSNPHTLLTKFYGLHRIQVPTASGKSRKIRFIVMGNVFNSEVPIHQRFDLKGSTQGRKVKDRSRAAIWKDLDLDIQLRLEPGWKARLDRQLAADTDFLRRSGVMDYSLLMGVHFKDREQVPQPDQDKVQDELAGAKQRYMRQIINWDLEDSTKRDITFLVQAQLHRKRKYHRLQHELGSRRNKGDAGAELAFQLGEKRVQLGLGMAAAAVHTQSGQQEDAVVYFGIIDFLQEYSPRKKAEHALKAVRYDGKTISVVNPDLYCQRFMKFMSKVFC